jgi:TPR repeat protein
MEIHPSSVAVRLAHFLNGIGLVDEALPGSYAEDYEWLLRAARRGPIVAVPEPLVTISWNHASYFAERWETIAQALRYLLDRYPEFRTVPRGLARVQGQVAFALAACGRRREALAWAQRSLSSSRMEPRGYLAVAVAAGLVSPESVLHVARRFGKGI